MAITTLEELSTALKTKSQRFIFDKGFGGSASANRFTAQWTIGNLPEAGTAPTTQAVCTNATTGAIPFVNPTGTDKTYIVSVVWPLGNSSATNNDSGHAHIADRLAHMGGLSGTSTSSQTATLDVSGVSAARKGLANLSEIEWFLEIYSQLGATAATATVNVTYTDASSENLSVSVPATPQAGHRMPVVPAAGKWISQINTVTLSVSTGAAGDFGFSAARRLCSVVNDWGQPNTQNSALMMGLPQVPNDACLQVVGMTTGTSLQNFRGMLTLVQG